MYGNTRILDEAGHCPQKCHTNFCIGINNKQPWCTQLLLLPALLVTCQGYNLLTYVLTPTVQYFVPLENNNLGQAH